MKIVGNKDKVNMVTLIHKGKNIQTRCYSKPLEYMDEIELREDREVEITFDDLREVDFMILMLEKFKKACCEYIGECNYDKK